MARVLYRPSSPRRTIIMNAVFYDPTSGAAGHYISPPYP